MNMVQEVEGQAGVGRRERNRIERHRAFLATAKAIVATEGLDALTMQRLAGELDCAVGTAYTYFPSKSALVAEVQRAAIELLTEGYIRFRLACDAELASAGTTGDVIPLLRVLGFGRFCIAIVDTFPEETRLLQLLMAEGQRTVIDDADVHRVVPAAFRLVAHAADAFEAAAAGGALSPGNGTERTVVLLASLNGALSLDNLVRVDADLFDGRRLAAHALDVLLIGWGADPALLARAAAPLDALAARGPLVPRTNDL